MARRIITHTRRHRGRVVAVGNPQEWWSPRSVTDVITDIENQIHTYRVRTNAGQLVRVVCVGSPTRLQAVGHGRRDLLLELPSS